MTAPAVEVRDLVKTYATGWRGQRQTALNEVDLTVQAGEGVALVGPNGAGKSTLLMGIAGLRRPTAGTIRVFGLDPARAENRIGLGLLPDRPALYLDLTAEDHLRLAATAHQIQEPDVAIAEVMGRLNLGATAGRPVGRLSAGMVQRVALALALLPTPRLLLLDEPLANLDPESVRVVTDALAEERARGATLIVATHRLTELVGCCDRAMHVVDGTLQRLGSVEHVLVRVPVRVVYTLPPGATDPPIGALERSPPGLSIRLVPAARRDALVEQIRAAGGAVLSVSPMLEMLADGVADAEETLA